MHLLSVRGAAGEQDLSGRDQPGHDALWRGSHTRMGYWVSFFPNFSSRWAFVYPA